MKTKSAFLAVLAAFGAGLSGCPVYDAEDAGCYDDFDCRNGYVCDLDIGACVLSDDAPSSSNRCHAPGDCGTNETCSHSGSCKVGDCHFESIGCVSGYECSSTAGRWECVKEGSVAAGGAPSQDDTSSAGMAVEQANGGAE